MLLEVVFSVSCAFQQKRPEIKCGNHRFLCFEPVDKDRPSATGGRDGLTESCTCRRCRGGTPPPPLATSPPPPPPTGWIKSCFVCLPFSLQSFDHLCAVELVRPADSGITQTQKEFRLMTLLVASDQLKHALQKYPSCPAEVRQWANSATLTLSWQQNIGMQFFTPPLWCVYQTSWIMLNKLDVKNRDSGKERHKRQFCVLCPSSPKRAHVRHHVFSESWHCLNRYDPRKRWEKVWKPRATRTRYQTNKKSAVFLTLRSFSSSFACQRVRPCIRTEFVIRLWTPIKCDTSLCCALRCWKIVF